LQIFLVRRLSIRSLADFDICSFTLHLLLNS
jgi:hypothetical protein